MSGAVSVAPPNHVVVLFGASGDLAARKLIPGFYRLGLVGLMPDDFRIIGTSRGGMTDEEFREHAHDATMEFGRVEPSDGAWDDFAARLSYVATDGEDMHQLCSAIDSALEVLGESAQVLHYLSVPPTATADIVTALGDAGLSGEGTKVVLEKPFGTDLASAQALDETVHRSFSEEQVFRIDHFIGKEDVQNILAVRFSNRLFEPVWNSRHLSHIQIDVPETLGIENRASFYDGTGAFRDMVVTHLFQVLGFVAMEPPGELSADSLAAQKQKVFDSLVPLDPSRVVRGQYDGYCRADGVAEDSDTETMVALEVRIDNERWDGVPIYLRTGKRLAVGKRVITLKLRLPPMGMFDDADVHGNELFFEVGEPGHIRVNFTAKEPGPAMTLGEAHMDFDYKKNFDPRGELEAYERLLHDAMSGDRTLFNRSEGIERLWEVAQPLLDAPPPVLPYRPGSWGPPGTDELVAPHHWCLGRLFPADPS